MDTHENELPDDIRVPLHSLQADVGYLIGRVQADGSCGAAIAASITERLADIEKGIDRLRSQVSPVVEGWKLVPLKLDDMMLVEARATVPGICDLCDADIEDIYETALKFAPLPPSHPRGTERGCGGGADADDDVTDWGQENIEHKRQTENERIAVAYAAIEALWGDRMGWEQIDTLARQVVRALDAQPQAVGAPTSGGLTIADYEEVFADHKRLVREMDVLLNGDGAAAQASLCDLVAQIRTSRLVSRKLLDAAVAAERERCAEIIDGVAAAARESGASALENVLVGLAETVRSRDSAGQGQGGTDG